MNIKESILLIFTITVCSTILSVIFAVIFKPELLAAKTGSHIMDLLKFILGMIAGYLGAGKLKK